MLLGEFPGAIVHIYDSLWIAPNLFHLAQPIICYLSIGN